MTKQCGLDDTFIISSILLTTFWLSVTVIYDLVALTVRTKFHLRPLGSDKYFNEYLADCNQSLSARCDTKVQPFYAKNNFWKIVTYNLLALMGRIAITTACH